MVNRKDGKGQSHYERGKGGYMTKTDTITVRITGPKKIRQIVVNRVYESVFAEDLLEDLKNPKAELRFESTLDPTEEE